jgi:hypothetical protein
MDVHRTPTFAKRRRLGGPEFVGQMFRERYLQQTAGARANLAGLTKGCNGATIQSLEDAIRDRLKAGGDPRDIGSQLAIVVGQISFTSRTRRGKDWSLAVFVVNM